MSARSHHHKRDFVTVGTSVRTPLGERMKAAALFVGMTPAAWAREALIEKLERETFPSIVPSNPEEVL